MYWAKPFSKLIIPCFTVATLAGCNSSDDDSPASPEAPPAAPAPSSPPSTPSNPTESILGAWQMDLEYGPESGESPSLKNMLVNITSEDGAFMMSRCCDPNAARIPINESAVLSASENTRTYNTNNQLEDVLASKAISFSENGTLSGTYQMVGETINFSGTYLGQRVSNEPLSSMGSITVSIDGGETQEFTHNLEAFFVNIPKSPNGPQSSMVAFSSQEGDSDKQSFNIGLFFNDSDVLSAGSFDIAEHMSSDELDSLSITFEQDATKHYRIVSGQLIINLIDDHTVSGSISNATTHTGEGISISFEFNHLDYTHFSSVAAKEVLKAFP